MHRELPVYIFIRNTIVLCILFVFISAFIIEKGRQERGESSLFKAPKFKTNQAIDPNNYDMGKSTKYESVDAYVNISEAK